MGVTMTTSIDVCGFQLPFLVYNTAVLKQDCKIGTQFLRKLSSIECKEQFVWLVVSPGFLSSFFVL